MSKLTIGLFGTCANSTWRKSFIEKYEELMFSYFNPQVPSEKWTSEMAGIEAEHLRDDKILLFPVLKESFGFASLAEIGFAVHRTLFGDGDLTFRSLIVYIEPTVCEELHKEFPRIAKENSNARTLVYKHLKSFVDENPFSIYVVNSLEEMLSQSIECYNAYLEFDQIIDSDI